MLTAVSKGPSIVVCDTCKYAPDSHNGPDGRRGGAHLFEALEELRTQDPAYADISVQRMSCLFACSAHCTVHIRQAGKISYVLGRFAPAPEAAKALLDYTKAYAESDFGQVPFGQWPEGVKGHFLTRCPPEGFVAE